MGIERQPSGIFKGSVLDELVAMDYSGNSSRPLMVQSEGDGGDGGGCRLGELVRWW